MRKKQRGNVDFFARLRHPHLDKRLFQIFKLRQETPLQENCGPTLKAANTACWLSSLVLA
jgi:hypothetical protein